MSYCSPNENRNEMKKIFTLLFLVTFVCQATLAQNFAILLNEDFDAATTPTGWTQTTDQTFPSGISSTTPSGGWAFGQGVYSSIYWDVPASLDNTPFAISNDDPTDQNRLLDRLVSPLLDLTPFDSAVFLYDVFYDSLYQVSEGFFEISYDAGATWIYLPLEATTYANGWVEDGVKFPSTITVGGNQYSFNDQMKISFVHTDHGGWGTGVAIDNVIVAGYNTPCDDIVDIASCNAAQTVTLSGPGVLDWQFADPCQYTTYGQEQLYSFTPTTTGIHYLNVTAATGASWLDYMYKPASAGCDTLGWTCMGDAGATGSYPMNLTAGVEYLILVDNEFYDSETQTFEIQCPCSYTSGGNTAESETCGSNSNGGCNANPEAYESIACGGSVSGTLWADGGSRDTDWYELVVTEQTTISVDFSSGQPINVLLVDDCTNQNVLANSSSMACGSGTLSYSAAPGTYLLVIAPTSYESIPCGSGSANNYDITAVFCNPPVNDVCTGATSIACNDVVTGSTEFPVTNTDEPDCVPGAGVWYVFSGNGNWVTFSTDNAGTDFDTRIGYTDGCGNACIDYDEDGGDNYVNGYTSVLTFLAEQGTDYYVYVGGYQGTTVGNFELSVTCVPPPANDDCSGAVSLTVNQTCNSTSGDVANASESMSGCDGTADDDVWYSFVATGTTATVDVTGSSDFDAVLEVFSGSCGSLSSLECVDNSYEGELERVDLTGLSNGSTYYVRVYDYYSSVPTTTTFDICVYDTPPAPANDECSGAVSLAVNQSCVNTSGDVTAATESLAGCTGTANNDVWYSFVATTATATVDVAGSSSFDVVFEVFEGACGSLNSLDCVDNAGSGSLETSDVSGLTIGDTYYVRVYDYWSGTPSTPTFDICVYSLTVGIENALENGLSVYPNPSNGQFIVEVSGIEADAQIIVNDLAGRQVYNEGVVMNKAFRKEINLDVANGTYLLQIMTEEGTVTRKIQVN